MIKIYKNDDDDDDDNNNNNDHHHDHHLYCTVLSGVTMEAKAGMTIQGERWGQFNSAHCAKPLVCVFIDDAWRLLVTRVRRFA